MAELPPGWGRYPAHIEAKKKEPGIPLLQLPASPPPSGPIFPVQTTPHAWHMGAHGGPVPATETLALRLHRLHLNTATDDPSGVLRVGMQHNPSVFVWQEKLWVNMRVLHQRRTTNFLMQIDEGWNPVDARRLDTDWLGVQVEDIRPFVWSGALRGLAAVHDGNASAIYQGLLDIEGYSLKQVQIQPSQRHEKNWMPCVDGAELRVVYSVDPLIVLEVDAGSRLVSPSVDTIPQVKGMLRGGSQLIPWGGRMNEAPGWLAIIHEVHRPPKAEETFNPLMGGWAPLVKDKVAGFTPVVYLHRFAVFDADLTTVKISKPWRFMSVGIEFCAGLTWWKNKIVASFGMGDREAWLAEIDHRTIEETFP